MKHFLRPRCIWPIFLLIVSCLAEAAMAPSSSCWPILGKTPTDLTSIREEMVDRLKHIAQELKSLELDPETLVPGKELGSGWSGTVFKVTRTDHDYALKIITDPYSRYGKSEFQPSKNELHELDNAIIIQQALAKAGIAPLVYGVVTEEKLNHWINSNNLNRFPDNVPPGMLGMLRGKLGLLMELVSTNGLKQPHSPIIISPERLEQLKIDADHIEHVLITLGLVCEDLDAVITPGGRLKLLDTAWCHQADVIHPEVSAKLKRMLDKLSH